MELKSIKNVEVFRAGEWKGRKYTAEDLDKMVETWREVSSTWFRPAVKLGHKQDSDLPAVGYLDNVRRVGDKIVADIVDLAPEVYDAIAARRFSRVSVEIAPSVKREGKTYQNVIWSLALLGASVPEVSGLKPLSEALLAASANVGAVLVYDIDPELISHAEWDTAYINDLPDAAFAVIEPGGEKDEDGKTVPRALRHLPHHNKGVKDPDDNDTVDLPHLRNALARLDQTKLSQELKDKARRHLEKHAEALGIGEYAEQSTNVPVITAQHGGDEMEKEKLEALQKEVAEYSAQLTALKGQLEQSQKRVKELEERDRAARIDAKVAECKLPALRPFARVFYGWALDAGQNPICFSADGKDAREIPAVEVVDGFVAAVNALAGELLKQHANIPDVRRESAPASDNPQAEVDRRVREYMSAKNVDYGNALKAVLDADPELKTLYARI
jgi:TolA-binding protein